MMQLRDSVTMIPLLILTETGVLCDLYSGKIPNVLIVAGAGMGFFTHIVYEGFPGIAGWIAGMAVPILVLGWLFYFRMLGAGDIKLFCVLGGFLGAETVFRCILCAILAGGVISVLLLVLRRNLYERIRYFGAYVREYQESRVWKPYLAQVNDQAKFCFSIPVLISLLCYLGGVI